MGRGRSTHGTCETLMLHKYLRLLKAIGPFDPCNAGMAELALYCAICLSGVRGMDSTSILQMASQHIQRRVKCPIKKGETLREGGEL